MPHAVELPPPRDWQVFEDFCRDLFAAEWGDPEAQKHGRSGQKQHGVDIFGRRDGRWQAVQCKRKRTFPEKKLTEKQLRDEVTAAYQFSSPLELLVVATTAPPDAAIQAVAAKLTDDHAKEDAENKRFRVVVYGWSELCEKLQRHQAFFDTWQREFLGQKRSPRFYGLPPATSFPCLGRAVELERLHEEIQGNPTSAVSAHVALYGSGGVGKTRLAFEYAHRFAEHYSAGIFWTVVGNREPLAVWAELGRRRLASEITQDADSALDFFRFLDNVSEPRLIVLDDLTGDPQRFGQRLEIAGAWYAALPTSPNVKILITTRLSEVVGARPILVSRLGTDAAVKLLLTRAKREPIEMADEEALVDRDLDGHPLAVSLAGSYLHKVRQLSISAYRERLRESGLTEELETAALHAGSAIPDHERSIAATYRLSHDLLDPQDPIDTIARDLLDLSAFLAPGVEIDSNLVVQTARLTNKKTGSDQAELAAARLEEISLFEPGRRIHTLIADYVRWSQDSKTARRSSGLMLKLSNSLFPKNMKDTSWKILMPGGRDEWEELTPARRQHVSAINYLGDRISERHPKIAAPWLEKLAVSHSNIGQILLIQGESATASSHFEASKEVYERLRRRYPRNKKWRDALGQSHSALSRVLLKQGDQEGALSHMATMTKLLKKRSSKKKRVNRPRPRPQPQDLQTAQRNFEITSTKTERGLEQYIDEKPELLREPTAETAGEIYSIAGLYLEMGGLENLETAKKFLRSLVDLDPGNVQWQLDLAQCYRQLGVAFRNQGEISNALRELNHARDILQALIEENSEYVEWQLKFVEVCSELSYVTPADEAISYLDEGLEILRELDAEERLPHGSRVQITLLDLRRKTLSS